MIESFKQEWLDDFYFKGKKTSKISRELEKSLRRRLDIVFVANRIQDLLVPPANRFERLDGNLKGWCSIRVNKQYRLIFKWDAGSAQHVYLDPHKYR